MLCKLRMEWRDLMSQYRRIVSYLYQYLNGDKGQNMGYVRLEQKGRQCRIAVQMRASGISFMPEVWLFKQKSASIEYISIGKLTAYSGNLQIKIATNTDDVCLSGHPASDFDGAIIYINDKEYYATTWTNESIYIGEKVNMANKGMNSRPDDMESHTDKEMETADSSPNPESDTKGIPDSGEARNEETSDSSVHDVKMEMEYEKIPDNKSPDDSLQDLDDTDTLHITDIESEPDVGTQDIREENINTDSSRTEEKPAYACGACPFKSYNKKNEDFGMRILKNFPVMYPFRSGDIEESVRIEPKDIGCMPIRLWSFANNRFLLHGYYCYKHLIFARLDRGCYALGVPGVYSEQESRKAASFSFNEFQPIGPGKIMHGVFGYWFTEIHV